MSDNVILALNCGSSSIKFAVFDAATDPLPRQPLWSGKVGGIGGPAPEFDETGTAPQHVDLDAAHPTTAALQVIRARVMQRLQGRNIAGVVHRVVHGGQHYFAPVRVTQQVIDELRGYIPLAPLHQPFPLKAMSLLLDQHPDVPQVACFDTAFHRTAERVEQLFALPAGPLEEGPIVVVHRLSDAFVV